ncbi:hypothetical protein ACFYPK_27965 [Streptomyces halstedii]|uniref:hypothetical protein n=1 Tax=Streptomyces halstedii TaxID=1944 RepID=UPI00345F4AC1
MISLMLRTDSYRDTGDTDPDGAPVREFVPARREPIDLLDLTPRARTLAEAIHQAQQHPGPMGPAEIMLQCDRTTAEVYPRQEDEARAYGPREREHERARRHFVRSVLRSASEMSGAEYLEREARSWPMDWYIVGVRGLDPVPSFEAGRTDRVYTHDTAREALGLTLRAWDLLTHAKHLPSPDRWAHGRPHWYPATIDAYRTREVELWPVSKIAERLGYEGKSSANAARAQLGRWGLLAMGRETGRSGESLYAADQVEALQAHRPGRGRRGAARIDGKFAPSSP